MALNNEKSNSKTSDMQASLRKIDAILQFLTKATGETTVSMPLVRNAVPTPLRTADFLKDVQSLVALGLLQANALSLDWDDAECRLGFCQPQAVSQLDPAIVRGLGSLHNSTKVAAQRRLVALQRILDKSSSSFNKAPGDDATVVSPATAKTWSMAVSPTTEPFVDKSEELQNHEEPAGMQALKKLFGFLDTNDLALDVNAVPTCVLPRQVSYAGSLPAQPNRYGDLSGDVLSQIPVSLQDALGLRRDSVSFRRLFSHQAIAIEAIMSGSHCSICSGTGSGKSLCFLVPLLSAAYYGAISLVLFPTKALAQDQLGKLRKMLQNMPTDTQQRIRPAALDGDTPHAERAGIAATCNVILTNPDTLHAALLPNWKKLYRRLFRDLQYVVIDEAHMYEGVFGAHVAMILSRLARVTAVARLDRASALDSVQYPIFILASATLPWPERHFRRLCPVGDEATLVVLTSDDDGSPRCDKHFFCWNPPILHPNGTSTGQVFFARGSVEPSRRGLKRMRLGAKMSMSNVEYKDKAEDDDQVAIGPGFVQLHRRHPADETALLLAKAVSVGVRSIAFCKTRGLVEWVYERALTALQSNTKTKHLVAKVESYRGGYTMEERRLIEKRLFDNDILGVVGTNALELGVDIGGIDLTLHCGYPASYSSLMQQAGRAGRGKDKIVRPSCAVVVCFNSPSEQHFWRNPRAILGRGDAALNPIPMSSCVVQGHLVCASEEFPLSSHLPVTTIASSDENRLCSVLPDQDLFGGPTLYDDALVALTRSGAVTSDSVRIVSKNRSTIIYRAHPSVHKAWSRFSIRSIEPVQYAVVNIAHPRQQGKMDGILDEAAIMDSLPYSRVFYHAHPGAIITHRGRSFKILSMSRPPAFLPENFGYRRNLHLAAFAKPTTAKYATRPLSTLHITVVKQLECAQSLKDESWQLVNCNKSNCISLTDGNGRNEGETPAEMSMTLAGCGAVNVKRSVHGYKKLSLISRRELSRTELSLPDMEYDTFGLWIDACSHELIPRLPGELFGGGVHALSHAILAVAPILIPGLVRADLECDHAYVYPTRICLFDERAGGSGASELIWQHIFCSDGLFEAALDLLRNCPSCHSDDQYDGGCPACIYAPQCLKFNMHLSKSAAIVVGGHVLERIKETDLYHRSHRQHYARAQASASTIDTTPRRKKREQAMIQAKELRFAQGRQYVVGRASLDPLSFRENRQSELHD